MTDLPRPPRFGPYQDARGWLRGLGVALAAGVFMAISGAFGTGGLPILKRLIYWLPLMLLGLIFGAFVGGFFFRGVHPIRNAWLNALAAAVAMSAPFTLVVAVASRWLLGSDMRLAALPVLFLSVLTVSLVMVAINILLERRRAVVSASPAPAKFLERLPLKLRGAEVWAVEAEDHYLRLHTSRGQDLILMRLADAIAELEGIEGAQVHRSWWVARDAVTDARKGDGRATLTLKDGARVPVSRTYAGQLREKRWI